MTGYAKATVACGRAFLTFSTAIFLLLLTIAALLLIAAPSPAEAASPGVPGGTCTIAFGTVPYGSSGNTHVQAEGTAEQIDCDPRYPAADSGVAAPNSGASTGGGTWSAVTNVSDNTVTYAPHARWVGPDTFTMYFCNDVNCTGVGRVTATVNVTVAAPTISLTASLPNGTVATAYSQTLTASGVSGPYTFSLLSGTLPTGLTLTGATSTTITLSGTPTAGGTFNFTIRATDNSIGAGPLTHDQAYTVTMAPPTISVSPTTIPNGTRGTAYSRTLTANGGTAPRTWSVSSGALPAGLTLSTTGVVSGTPTATGSFTFVARAQDSSSGTGAPYAGTRSYTFSIAEILPVANAVSATVAYGSTANPITLDITGGPATSVAVAANGTHGTATAVGTSITYSPTAGYAGPDSFTYTATNVAGTSAAATVTITVLPQPPVTGAASATVGFNSTSNPITLNLSGGAATSVAVATNATNGTATASGTSITYTPTSGYFGADSFTYTATNASGTSTPATVTITVNPAAPVANAVSASLAYGSSGNPITLNITGGPPASVAVAANATNGTATASGTTITYTPTAGYSGPDSFTYTATNVTGTSAPAIVTINVHPQSPIAGAVSTTVTFDSVNNPISLAITGGTPTSVAVPTGPTHGSVSIAGTSITYTPTSGYFGPDSFAYTATNAGGTSTPATVSITVDPAAPVANAVSATVAYGSAGNPITLNITGGPPDSLAVTTPATNGTAAASGTTITYTPGLGYFGPDSFTYTATNVTGTSAPATVTITVAPQLPATASVITTVDFNSTNNPITLNITGGTPTSVAVPTGPNHGSVSIAGTSITYTPTTGYFGPDNFTYTASNAGGTSTPAMVAITVNPAAPVTGDVIATVAANSATNPISLNITGGPADSVAVVIGATHGTATASGTTITYTPTPGFSGSDSFTYTATNVTGTSGSSTASITVNPPTLTLSAIPTTADASTPYSATITASLGTPAYQFTVPPGTLPDGLGLSTAGVLSGTPTVTGPFTFTVTATDTYGATGSRTYSMTIGAPTITIASPAAGALPGATGGTAYSQTFTASGGQGSHSFDLTGALPAGMSFASAGVLSGTPSVSGTFNFTLVARDSSPGPSGPFTSAPVAYSLTVAAPTITVSPASLPNATASLPYSQTLTAGGGTAPYSFSLNAGSLPVGMSLSSAGAVSGTPTVTGTYNFTVTATDTHGFTGSQAYSVVVDDQPGQVTMLVSSPADGAFGFSSGEPSLNFTVNTASGSGTSGARTVPIGNHSFALSVPAGFELAAANCSAGGAIDPATLSGTLNVTPGAAITCTISGADPSETTGLIGTFLEARSNLILTNEPNASRRIERLTGAYTGTGGVSGFGLGFSDNRMPFALSLSENEASFGYSLRRSQAQAGTDMSVVLAREPSLGARRGMPDNAAEMSTPLMAFGEGGLSPAKRWPIEARHNAAPDEPGGSDPTLTPFDVWIEGKLARFDSTSGDGRFGILHAGMDYLVTPRILIGLGAQLDWTDMEGSGSSTMSGTGYLFGPYVTARLTDHLFLDGRAAWGQSANDVSPFGTYTDKLDATRRLVSVALIGQYDIDRWSFSPKAKLSYFEEAADPYVDGLGIEIPAISIATGTFEFGPTLSYSMELANGMSFEPFTTLEGIWTFKQENTATSATSSPGLAETGLRGRGEVGFTLSGQSASSLSTSVFYDGVGNDDFQAWGGRLRFNHRF